MAGQIKLLIDTLISEKSKGNPVIADTIRKKLILKGINVPQYTDISPDDAQIIEKIKGTAAEMGITF